MHLQFASLLSFNRQIERIYLFIVFSWSNDTRDRGFDLSCTNGKSPCHQITQITTFQTDVFLILRFPIWAHVWILDHVHHPAVIPITKKHFENGKPITLNAFCSIVRFVNWHGSFVFVNSFFVWRLYRIAFKCTQTLDIYC